MSGPRVLRFDDVKVGDVVAEISEEITAVQNVVYAAATWDFFRIHYDAEYVRSGGQERPFVDGQMFGAMLSRMLTRWSGVAGNLKKMRLNYRQMAFIGDVVTCRGRVLQKRSERGEHLVECELAIQNQDGEQLISDGLAVIALPG